MIAHKTYDCPNQKAIHGDSNIRDYYIKVYYILKYINIYTMSIDMFNSVYLINRF